MTATGKSTDTIIGKEEKTAKRGPERGVYMDLMTMAEIEDLKRTLQEIKEVLEEIRDILREET